MLKVCAGFQNHTKLTVINSEMDESRSSRSLEGLRVIFDSYIKMTRRSQRHLRECKLCRKISIYSIIYEMLL